MRTMLLTLSLALAGCSSAASTYQPTRIASPPAMAFADKASAPAKGTKTCHVRQYTSAHLEGLRAAEKAQYGGMSTVPYTSDIFAKVSADGTVGLAVNEDTYPGTNAYFLLAGKRYSGDGDGYVMVPKSAAGGLIQYTYTSWPYRSEVSREDVFGGFAGAYEQCVDFLK